MSSIPGPIIQFRIGGAELAGNLRPALDQIKNEAKAASQQIAEQWRVMAGQIRASIVTEASGTKEIAAQRQQLISVLNQELSLRAKATEMSKSDLANFKAMTLELERQKSFLAGTGGLTTGTSNALNQVSLQTTLGISRILDSLVNRYFGGAAGAAFRTVRDVGYYGALGAQGGVGSSAAAEGGAAGGLGAGLGGIVDTIGPATVGLGSLAAALSAVGITAATVTRHMEETAQAIANTSAETGLSTKQIQEFTELAKEMDLDAGSVANAVARLQAQLGQYILSGKTADQETQAFIRTSNILGVSLKDSHDKLRPINDVLGDFAEKLQQIPDAETRTAVAIDAFGIRGRVLAEAMNTASVEGKSLKQVLQEIGSSNVIIPDSQIDSLLRAKAAWDEVSRSVSGYATLIKGVIADTTLLAVRHTGEFAKDIAAGPLGLPKFLGDIFNTNSGGASGSWGPPIDVQKLQQAAALEKEREEYVQKRAEFESRIWKEFDEHLYRGTGEGARLPAAGASTLIDRFLQFGNFNRYQIPAPPLDLGLGVGLPAPGSNVLGGLGTTSGPASPYDALIKQIQQEHDDLFTSQFQKDAQYYADSQKQLTDALNAKLISQQQWVDASKQLEADWAKTLTDLDKGFADQAGKLFDDLVSGKTHAFGQSLLADIKNIALSPIKNIFDSVVGGIFGSFSRLVNAPFGNASSTLGGIFGGLFGGGPFGGGIGPGGTAGTFAGPLGIFSKIGGLFGLGGGAGSGPQGTPTNPVYVAFAGIGGAAGGAAGSGAGGLGGIVGGIINGLIPNGSSGVGNLPLGGIDTSSLSALSGALNPSLIGAASSSASGASILGGLFGGGAKLGSGIAGLGSIAGSLLIGLGSQTGGALGGLEGGAGGALSGALTGLMLGGPIGAGIGALIGGIGGLVSGLLGGPSFAQQVNTAKLNQAYYAPPSETFSFASNGSIGSTLSTGFTQSGSSFGQFTLPKNTPFTAQAITGPLTAYQQQLLEEEYANSGGNQPFGGFNPSPFSGQGPVGNLPKYNPSSNVAINVSAIDAKGVSDFFNEHSETIGAITNARNPSSSASGFGSASRLANNLP